MEGLQDSTPESSLQVVELPINLKRLASGGAGQFDEVDFYSLEGNINTTDATLSYIHLILNFNFGQPTCLTGSKHSA